MSDVTWSIQGPHFINCNCDYGCPCQFWGPPTDGTCRAVTAWRIDEGHHGDVRLDGLCAVNTYAWPGPIHEGNGSMQSIIDERADEAQRRALIAILQGEGADPGSVMLQIYRTMCVTVHEPLFKPIRLAVDVEARTARVIVPGVLETVLEPIKNKVTGALHRARIDLPFGKEFNLAEVASGTTRATGKIPLEFTNTHAHLVHNRLTSQGVAR
ncbi:MAG TPA: DUF1326 domain-containing protein [Methylomirabilota bacterium]|jgi:hypothetical protein|nr:DUF1326 domain-containing protein [Methylomirabilota bacterium]